MKIGLVLALDTHKRLCYDLHYLRHICPLPCYFVRVKDSRYRGLFIPLHHHGEPT